MTSDSRSKCNGASEDRSQYPQEALERISSVPTTVGSTLPAQSGFKACQGLSLQQDSPIQLRGILRILQQLEQSYQQPVQMTPQSAMITKHTEEHSQFIFREVYEMFESLMIVSSK